ncbi:nucleotide exchange factor GrpE [candidate division KSB1 bacterium]|nr:nucleotide exchange factor GrpE [candidate division KSB1 bacterium]NIR70990.1 nucleotide exchange factor GrpE [candidate division KSB1 bacterium]NIS24731.1 nucleotide exchange factor GrpE [candidate division KSB1 bacterium]NIT71635.1 nucleotide exchange factor GrpE [candidate division KSB1 bacterium]NIU25342.1 nucleotide exchange factor GrpE [candidate division KSB1 bacterium]
MEDKKDIRLDEQDINQSSSESHESSSLENWEEKYRRVAADFANYKRRTEAEWASVRRRTEERLLESLLPIFDDFLRLTSHKAEDEQIAEGVEAVQKKWLRWLETQHVEVMHPKGEEFDHESHDAVLHEPVDDPELDGKVVHVIDYGYRRNGEILRHPKVAVGRYVGQEGHRQEDEYDGE